MTSSHKEKVLFVMQHANCDMKSAKAWLKHHNGNMGQAVVDARGDAFMQRLNAEKITMKDLCK